MRRFFTIFIAVLLCAALAAPAQLPAASSGDTPAQAAKHKGKKRCGKGKKRSHKSGKCVKTKKKKCAKGKRRSKKTGRCIPIPGKPGTPAPGRPRLEPFDYLKNLNLTVPKFKEFETISLNLPVPGGETMYVEVTKPKGATNVGVIMEASGYHGTLYGREGTRILPLPLNKNKEPLGLKGYFPQFGYAVLMMDLRGTGKSGGCLDHLGPNDKSDIKAVVEWAATQPWSNGRVGLVGHSYVGSTPQVAAAGNPKGLVTIVPSAGLAKIWDHQFHGGVPWNAQFLGPIEAYAQLAAQSDLPEQFSPVSEVSGNGPTGDGFGANLDDTGCGFTNTALNAGPSQYWGQVEAWHKARDHAKAAAEWPGHVFLVHGVNDQAARVTSMLWFGGRGARPGDKLWMGQWDHGIGCCPNQRGMQWTEALHAWFDRQLLQRDVDTGPPVEIYLNDQVTEPGAIPKRQEIYTSEGWPGPQKLIDFGAGGDGTLVQGKPGPEGSISFQGDPQGYATSTDDTGRAEFVTPPATQEMLFIGEPQLDLVVSTVGQRPDIVANLFDVAPSGEKRRISTFAINPLLRDSYESPSPVVPLLPMRMKAASWFIAHKWRPGHRLMLRVSASDDDHLPFGAVDARIEVLGGDDGTVLKLPQVDSPKYYKDAFPVGPPPKTGGPE